jgi:hypothetical protein
MRVEVIKSCGGYWYSTRTGEQFDVKEKHDNTYYVTVGDDVRHIHEFHCKVVEEEELFVIDAHYNNSNGSLYKFAADHDLNAYEFDAIKRLVRCRKKGQFLEDLEKTKRVIDLYIAEHDQSSVHSRCYGGSVKEEDKTKNR